MSEAGHRSCPNCSRPAATSGPRCLYCGAALPEAAEPPAQESGASATSASPHRALLVLDLTRPDPERLAAALGLRLFESRQLGKRGGLHLHRVAEEDDVRSEAARLREAGLAVVVVPEAAARVAPVLAVRGRYEAGVLAVRHAGGELRLSAKDVLMVVQGPISREYQPAQELKRVRAATLEAGYRFHLHRHDDSRPVELDPGSFAFGPGARGDSSLLTLSGWVRELAAGAPADDEFRRLPPALGAASAEGEGALQAASGLVGSGAGRPKDAPLILDNLAQFRYYSGWRAAVERARRG